MLQDTIDAIRAHAAQCAPAECCGVVIIEQGAETYIPCRNTAQAGQFEIAPEDYAAAEDRGEVIRIVHSHVYEAPVPSMADRVGCEASGIPWLIVNHPTGEWLEFLPSGYVVPLLDRPYCWGVFDCGTLARDYYVSQGIPIDADPQCWAVPDTGAALPAELQRLGFMPVHDLQVGDLILMDVRGNFHCGVYLGDEQFIHHAAGQLSRRDVYGPIYRRYTVQVLRPPKP